MKQNWKYLIGATLLHALFAGLFGLTMISLPRQTPPPQLAIQAVIVDQPLISSASRQRQQERERAERERQLAAEREKAAAEQRRQKEAEAQREVEQRAEQERQVQVKQQQEREQQRVQEQQQRDAERKRQADVEKQRQAEAERKRVADIERKQQEEAQRRKAAEDARALAARQEELKNQLAAEEGEMEAVSAGLKSQYMAMIQQHIYRYWNKPPSARPGLECEIRLTQTQTGTVLSAQMTTCNGDAVVRQSIENAVIKASPLPPAPDRRVFDRNVVLIFRPTE